MSRLARSMPAGAYKLIRPAILSSTISKSDSDSILGAEAQSLALTAVDSSLVSETQITALTSVDSSLGSENQTVSIVSTEAVAGAENSSLALSSSDSCAGTDASVAVNVAVSSTDNSVESETQIFTIATSDSVVGIDTTITISISDTDNGHGQEDPTISLSSSDTCLVTDSHVLGVSGYDSSQEGEVSSPPVVGISTTDNILLGDYQLGSRMAYKIFVSNFSSDVGIPSIIELTTGLPQLTIAPLGVTAVASSDSIATTETSNISAALSGADSSVETDVAVGVAIGISTADSSTMVENSSLLTTTTVSSSDSCVAIDGISVFSTNILATEISGASESSALNIISTDSISGNDTALLELFRNDTDHSTTTEVQALSVALSSTDFSVGLDVQNTTILFSSSDSIVGTDSNGLIAEATSDVDSGAFRAEQQSLSTNLIQPDVSIMADAVVGLVVHISDVDSCHIHEDQPFFFFDSDSIGFQETAQFSVSQRDFDECVLVSETTFFVLQSTLTMEWAVFPHLNQVVFAQPLNQ